MRFSLKPPTPVIPTDLWGWYDFSDESTVTLYSNRITALRDKGPRACNLTQPVLVDTPFYGVDFINGLNTGTSLPLMNGQLNGPVMSTPITGVQWDTSVYVVYQSTSVQNGNAGLVGSSTPTPPGLGDYLQMKYWADILYGDPTARIETTPSQQPTLGEIHSVKATADVKTYRNGAHVATATSSSWSVSNLGMEWIQTSLFLSMPHITFDGAIGEVIIYYGDGAYKGDTFREHIASYLMTKWGITP